MRTLNVILNGARGGQGTSTISAALALYAAGHADTQLVATDPSVTAALLGIPETVEDDGEIAVTDRLTLTGTPSGEPQVRVIDAGTSPWAISDGAVHLVVLRGPCYVALRSVVRSDGHRPDGIVLLSEPGRSLTERDVRDVTGIPVIAAVPVTPMVARTIDAGLLITRLHRLRDLAALRRYATRLLAPEPAHDPTSVLSPALTEAAADLNELAPRTPVKMGTDLPVALCATGRGLESGAGAFRVGCRLTREGGGAARSWSRVTSAERAVGRPRLRQRPHRAGVGGAPVSRRSGTALSEDFR